MSIIPGGLEHELPSLSKQAASVSHWKGILERLRQDRARLEAERSGAEARLLISPRAAAALDTLSDQLFSEMLRTLEQKLTLALQEVLEQPLTFHAKVEARAGGVSVEFSLKRNGYEEDIMMGTGGSVANILSVGLRMFALAALDPTRHAPVLLLDEQDCWLRPDLVPRLSRIIAEAARALNFQVIMISHHHTDLYARWADRVVTLIPEADGIRAVHTDPGLRDAKAVPESKGTAGEESRTAPRDLARGRSQPTSDVLKSHIEPKPFAPDLFNSDTLGMK
jgi:hypothetical protein